MDSFYQDLPVLQQFQDISRTEAFTPVPEGWMVVITDLIGSKQAIRDGKYREVNLLGASCIVAVLNAVPDLEVPFVFGGDGATFLVPEPRLPAVQASLQGLQRKSKDEFGMTLRAGALPMADIYQAGQTLRIAKVRMAEQYDQAMFMGGGLRWAEERVKREGGGAFPEPGPDAEALLSGLECRWRDLPSPKGETMALLIRAKEDQSMEAYGEVLEGLRRILGSLEEAAPLRIETLLPSFSPNQLRGETKLRKVGAQWKRVGYLAKIWFQNVLLKAFVRFNVTTGTTNWNAYLAGIVEKSDFRKFDEMLRLVIACTPQEREACLAFLEERFQAGALAYGHHVTNRALITCMVFERMGRQVHFIDAADGGYAVAALDLGRRVQALMG